MPNYNVLDADGNVVNTIVAESTSVDFLSDYTLKEVEPVAQDGAAAPRVWTQDDVRSALTLAEKTKWDNDSAPEVVTAKIEIGMGLEEAAITEVLDFLVDASVISADSKAAVLA